MLPALLLVSGIAVFAQKMPPVDDSAPRSWEKPIALCWTYSAEILLNVPIISNSKALLFIPLSDGGISAVDSSTGKQSWHADLGGEVDAISFVRGPENGKLIVMTRQEGEEKDKASLVMQALSEESGITAWRKELENSPEFYVSANATTIFLARDDGDVSAYKASDGELIWHSSVSGKITTAPAMNDRSLFAGTKEKKIDEISLETGKIVQEFPAASGELTGPMIIANDAVVYADQIGNIFAVRLADRKVLWSARAGAEVTNISATEFGLLVSSNDNFAYMLAPSRGDRKWKSKFTGRLVGKPVLNESHGMFITAAGKGASVLNLANGKFVNGIALLDEAFIVGESTGITGGGFSLLTSEGIKFYAPSGCPGITNSAEVKK